MSEPEKHSVRVYEGRVVPPCPDASVQILSALKASPGLSFGDLAERLGLPRPAAGKPGENAPTRVMSQSLQAMWDMKMIYPVTSPEEPSGRWYLGVAPS